MISLADSLKIDYREHIEEINYKVIAMIQSRDKFVTGQCWISVCEDK